MRVALAGDDTLIDTRGDSFYAEAMFNTPVTKTELARLLCRAFSIYFFVWAVSEACSLPEFTFSFIHYVGQQSVTSRAGYWTAYYLLRIILVVIKLAVFLIATAVFWRRGPNVLGLFLGPKNEIEPGAIPSE